MSTELGAHLDELTMESRLEFTQAPFGVVIGDETWTAATNGWAMAAIREDLMPLDDEGAKRVGPYLGLCHPAPDAQPVEIQIMREFLGDYEPPTKCEECDGSGEVHCTCPRCEDEHLAGCDCDGGTIPPDSRPVVIRGGVFNANVLAHGLACLNVREGRAWCRVVPPPSDTLKVKGFVLALWTDDWRLLLMSFDRASVSDLFGDVEDEFTDWLPESTEDEE